MQRTLGTRPPLSSLSSSLFFFRARGKLKNVTSATDGSGGYWLFFVDSFVYGEISKSTCGDLSKSEFDVMDLFWS